jgi:tetratricopeptide (TPR) repeat protein
MAIPAKPTDVPPALEIQRTTTQRSAMEPPKSRTAPIPPKLERVYNYIAKGEYQLAFESIPPDNRDVEFRNNRAVCLMRLGRFETAIPILKELVVASGTSWSRSDVPEYIKANYATALFYGGLPSGASDLLVELSASKLPAVQQLSSAMNRWVSGMGFWRRLDWKINGIPPKTKPIPGEDPVGIFSWDVA